LSWSSSTQSTYPVAGYAIYRGTTSGGESSIPIATVDANTTSYTDKNVELSTTYYYIVKAFDNQSPANYSEPSNEVSAKITDTAPPNISISYPIYNTTVVETGSITVTGTATDESGIEKVTINGSEVSVVSNGSFSKTVYLSERINTITIIATDKAGNKATKTITVTYKPAPVKKTVVTVQIGSDVMTVNGKAEYLTVAPEIKNDHTYLPLRAIAEALGAKVDWVAATKGITLTLGKHTVGLQIGNASAVVNGNKVAIFPPYLKPYGDGTFAATMVPLRVIAEGLDARVGWDNDTRTVTIIAYGG